MGHSSQFGVLVFLLIPGGLMGGCRRADPPKSTAPAPIFETPKDAYVAYLTAFRDGDAERVYHSVQFSHELQRKHFDALLAFMREARVFRDEFVRAYGELAWVRFQDPNVKPEGGNARFPILFEVEDDLGRAHAATIEQIGEGEFLVRDGSPEPNRLHFVKVERGWRMNAEDVCPAKSSIERETAILHAWVADLQRFRRAIGRPGISAEDIDCELGRAMMTSMTGEKLAALRFDINKLP